MNAEKEKRARVWTPEKVRLAGRAAHRAIATLHAEYPRVYLDTYARYRAEHPFAPRYKAQSAARAELKIRFPARYAELYARFKREEGLEGPTP